MRQHLDDFEKWHEGQSVGDHENLKEWWIEALSDGRFGPLIEATSKPFVYRLNTKTFDFNPVLADPECFGQPKRIESFDAFEYLVYRRIARSNGVEPGAFVDFRRYVKSGADGSEFVVVYASDC